MKQTPPLLLLLFTKQTNKEKHVNYVTQIV